MSKSSSSKSSVFPNIRQLLGDLANKQTAWHRKRGDVRICERQRLPRETRFVVLHSSHWDKEDAAYLLTSVEEFKKGRIKLMNDGLKAIKAGSILLVDDDPGILENYAKLLAQDGCTVKTAGSTKEACMLLANNKFDLLILDWDLQGSGGILEGGSSVLRAGREQDPKIPVIVISGYGPKVETTALMSGADQFFMKPPDASIFSPLVSRWLERAQIPKQGILPKRVEDIRPLAKVEKEYVTASVDASEGNISLAAQKLGVHRHTVASIIRGEKAESESAEDGEAKGK